MLWCLIWIMTKLCIQYPVANKLRLMLTWDIDTPVEWINGLILMSLFAVVWTCGAPVQGWWGPCDCWSWTCPPTRWWARVPNSPASKKVYRDGILEHQSGNRLDLLLLLIFTVFPLADLKKTRFFSGFKNTYKKSAKQENWKDLSLCPETSTKMPSKNFISG